MNNLSNAEKDLFSAFELDLTSGHMEIGRTYPIYGQITKVISDAPGAVVAEINSTLELQMPIPGPSGIELLKQHSFDWGIFVTTITEMTPALRGHCETVIFGRQASMH